MSTYRLAPLADGWKDAAGAIAVTIGVLAFIAFVQSRYAPLHSSAFSVTGLVSIGFALRAQDRDGVDATAWMLFRRAATLSLFFALGAFAALGWICPLVARHGSPFASLTVEAARLLPLEQLTLSDLSRLQAHFTHQEWPQLMSPVVAELRTRILMSLTVPGISCVAAAIERGRRARSLGFVNRFAIGIAITIGLVLLAISLVATGLSLGVSMMLVLLADVCACAAALWIFKAAEETGELEPTPAERLQAIRAAAPPLKAPGRILDLH